MRRRCSTCGADGPFYERSGYCKPCHIAYTGARRKAQLAAETPEKREVRLAERRLKRHGRAERVMSPPNHAVDGVKRCNVCEIPKPVESFYRDRNKRDGVAIICKECALARHKEYYAANRAERIAYQTGRRNADPVAARAYEREVYERRRAKHQASNKARMRKMSPLDADSLAYDGILRGDPCCYCGAPMEHVDHIDPIASGGANHWKNLTAACQPCNRAKSDKSLLTYLAAA